MTMQLDDRIAHLGVVDSELAGRVAADARIRLGTLPTPVRRPRRTPRIAAAAGIVAVAVAAFIVVPRPFGGSHADAAVLRRALVAVTPPAHTIQHIRQVLRQGSLLVRTESWQSIDDPGSARRIQTDARCDGWAEDTSNSLTEQQWYDPDHDRILRVALDPAKVRASWPPLGGPRTEFDPTVPFSIAMRDGSAQVVGATTYEGIPVTHISWPEDPASDPDGTARNSLYVDDVSGAPVVYFWGGGRLDATGGVVAQQRFLTYEFLPAARAVQALTETAAHPDAQVMPFITQAQFDVEYQAAQRVHCPGVNG